MKQTLFEVHKLGPNPSVQQIRGSIQTRPGKSEVISGVRYKLVDICPSDGSPTVTGYVPISELSEDDQP